MRAAQERVTRESDGRDALLLSVLPTRLWEPVSEVRRLAGITGANRRVRERLDRLVDLGHAESRPGLTGGGKVYRRTV